MDKTYFVYIMTNKHNTVLYIGVTNNIARRVWEHKNKTNKGFTKKYNTDKLVHLEQGNDINWVIYREKQLKNWHSNWKRNLITQNNPEWKEIEGI